MQRVLKAITRKQDAHLILSCLALAVCSSAFVWVSDSLPAPSLIHAICSLACILGGVTALCFGLACLSHEGRPSRVGLLALAPPVIGRCALIILATLMLIVLYGCLAFLLDQALFPHIGTQAALSFLETVAALGALVFAPLPVMLLVGWALRRESGFHPIRELRSVQGAYLPLLAIILVTALAGLAVRSLVALFGSGPVHLGVYLGLSCVLGAAWLLASALACKRTFACGGTSDWWKASASRLWNRKIRKPAAAGISCVLALALSFSLIGFALPALAEEAPDAPRLEPVEPDIYTPAEDGVSTDADAGSAEPSLSAAGATDIVPPDAAPEDAEAEETEMPALPPEDYYEQPEVEGTPVAIEGEATLLKVTERNYTTVIGGADVAYEDASGTIRKIDNELIVAETDEADEPVVYRNKANAFTAELSTSEEAGSAGLTLKTDGYEVGLIPQDVDFSRACAEGEAIRYTEARSGIDWQYTLVGSVVKEDIVLAHPVEAQSFDTRIDLPRGLDARMEEGVCVIFRPATAGAEEYEVMRIAAPIATDAAGEVSANLTLDLAWIEGVPYLTLSPYWEWLEAPERAYPVRIDPTVDIASAAVRVGCVEQQWRNVHVGENGYAYAGYDDGAKTGTGAFNHGLGHAICRTYAEINYDFSYIMSEARIDSATFSLYQHRAYSGGATNFGLYRVMEPWDFDGITWANQESLTHELVCFRQANTSPGYIDWDVRECVNNWVQGVWTQRGFCVKAEYERGMQCEMFQNRYAANPPRLTVNWSIPDPVDEGRSLDDITVLLRPLTEHDADNKLQFDGVFADGEATPRSTIAYTLDPTGEMGLGYASRSYKYPDSSEWQASIPNATRYKDKLSNWQSHVFSNLAFDTLYKVRAIAMLDSISGKEGTSDTFLIYKASAKDTLPYIASHYGTTLDQLARDNRVQDCLVVGGNTIFVRNPKTTTAYNPGDLTEDQKRRIDSGLMGRGKHCEYGFEPVNMNTGNFVLEGIDATAPDLDGDFEVRRTYNSKAAAETGALGRGWSLSFTDRLSAEASGAIVYTASDGASYWFDPDGEGAYVLDGDAGYALERIAYRPEGAAEDAPDLYRYEITDADGRMLSFDCLGMLTSVTSPAGLETVVSYGADHLMAKVTSPSGRAYSFEHDDMGRVSAVILPDGNRVIYGYDARGDLVSITEAGGGHIQYIYDAQGFMTEWRDPSGAPMVRNVYDDQGRVIQQLDANGNRSTLVYSDGVTHATDALGNVTTYRFDDLYRTTSVSYPDGNTISRAYDASGNLISDEDGTYSYDASGYLASSTDTRGQTTTYVNDEAGHILRISRPDGVTITYGYDGSGNCISETWSTGRAFTYAYDDLNRKVSETDADGVTTTFAYSGADLVAETDGLGNTTTHAYDAMGRCISSTDAAGHTSRTSYDAMGRIVAETDGAGAATRYALDARGLLLALTDANGAVTSFTYDAAANLTSMTDARGGSWHYAYDGVGNCVTETDPLGSVTTKAYDARGRLISQTDPEGVTETWTYDGRGRIITHGLPSGGLESFAYEGALEVPSREIDALGNVTSRTFTAMGEVASVTNPDGASESLTYTGDEISSHTSASGLTTTLSLSAAGRVMSVDRAERTWSYAYDGAGRIVAGTDPLGQTTSLGLDGAGNITSVTDAAGNATSFAYDGAGRILSTTDALGNVSSCAYDGLGNIVTETDAAGATTSYAYAPDGLLASVTDAIGNTTAYAYDGVGNLVSEVDARGAVTRYVYDGAGNLTLMTDALGRETGYAYDAAGNLTLTTLSDGSKVRMGYDAAGNVTSVTDAMGDVVTLTLDWRGNVSAAESAGLGRETYAYDAEGRLTSFTDAACRTATTAYDLWGATALEIANDGSASVYATDALGRVTAVTDGTGATTRYAYDPAGNVVSETDALGNISTYAYDAAGRMTSSTDAAGRTTAWTYDAVGNAVTETDADGYTSRATYDVLGRMVSQTDGVGSVTRAVYDPSGNLISMIDPLGAEETYGYDLAGQLISHTDAAGNTETLAYDARGNMVRHESVTGAVSTYAYDGRGNLIRETDPLGATTAYDVNAIGLATRVTAANGATYAYSYDAVGRMTRAASPLGYERTLTYGAADSPMKEADNSGRVVSYELDSAGRMVAATSSGATESWAYDLLGNVTAHTDRAGNQDAFGYDSVGNLVSYTDGAGISQAYAYDGRGNLTSARTGSVTTRLTYDGASNVISEATGSSGITRYAYDAAGQVISQTDGAGAASTYAYDALGNLTRMTNAAGDTWSYAYDPSGNLTSATSPLSATQAWDYDAAGRLQKATDASGTSTSYERDALGDITSMTDALGRVTSYSHDAEGNLTSITSPSGITESLSYDIQGRLTTLTNPSGATTGYDYDELGRLLSKSYSANAAERVTYTYDAEGRVESRTDATGTATYAYDGAGRLTSETDGLGQTLEYSYDDAGQLASVTYPDGTAVAYAYDDAGRMSRVSVSDGEYTYAYDSADRPVSLTRPDGILTRTEYDETGRVVRLVHQSAEGSVLSDLAYAYDAEGRIASEDESVADESGSLHTAFRAFTYTEAGELATCTAQEDGASYVESYSYDAVGNRVRLERTGSGADTVTYAYDSDDRLIREESAVSGITEYAYDADGQLISKASAAETLTYSYGVEGRLEAVRSGDLLLMSAVYDGDGNRVTSTELYHASRTLPEVTPADAAGKLALALTGGDAGRAARVADSLSRVIYAMAAMTGASASFGNAALLSESVPCACRIARSLFTKHSVLPCDAGDVATSNLPVRDADAVARSLGAVSAGLSVTDELYDVTTYVTSSIFDEAQVLASSSSRSGEVTYAFGLERLAAVREGLASALLADARGSIIQEAAGANTVTSWRRYGAFGDVTAGTDAQERSFFGYNGEEQSSVTGLIYLRARYYDTSSARFGVADTYLGHAFSPLTLNRYLYCNSDPINYCDPSGHIKLSVKSGYYGSGIGVLGATSLAKDASHPNWYKPTSGTKINNDSFAYLPGQRTITATLIPWGASRQQERILAKANINYALGQIAMRNGDLEGAKKHFGAFAARYIDAYRAYYCGGKRSATEYAVLHGILDVSSFAIFFPVIGALPDVINWWIYTEEGDEANAQLSLAYAGLGFFAGSAGKIGKLGKGAGFAADVVSALSKGEKAVKSAKETAKAIVGSEVKIGDKVIKNSSDAAELIVNAARKDSGLKEDAYHRAASYLDKEYLSTGTVFSNDGGTGILLQVEGGVNGRKGIFEYVVESDGLISHQRFIENGKITGKTNQK